MERSKLCGVKRRREWNGEEKKLSMWSADAKKVKKSEEDGAERKGNSVKWSGEGRWWRKESMEWRGERSEVEKRLSVWSRVEKRRKESEEEAKHVEMERSKPYKVERRRKWKEGEESKEEAQHVE